MDTSPTEIKCLEKTLIRIRWDDGHEGVYENSYVRMHCQCASCVHEWTGEKLINPTTIPKDIHPIKIEAIGNYAISIQWSDGHDTGIYPFSSLREICPCPNCEQT